MLALIKREVAADRRRRIEGLGRHLLSEGRRFESRRGQRESEEGGANPKRAARIRRGQRESEEGSANLNGHRESEVAVPANHPRVPAGSRTSFTTPPALRQYPCRRVASRRTRRPRYPTPSRRRRDPARRQPRVAAAVRGRFLPTPLPRSPVQHRGRPDPPHRATIPDARGDRTGFQGRRYRTRLLAESSYRDTFEDYLAFLAPRLEQAHRLLRARARSTSTSTIARRTTASSCSMRSSDASLFSTS